MDIGGLIHILIWLVVLGLIFGLLWWFIGVAGLPAPFDRVARVVVALVIVLVLIYFLLGILGPTPTLHMR